MFGEIASIGHFLKQPEKHESYFVVLLLRMHEK